METILGGGAATTGAAGALIKDSDTANFETDVIAASQEVPVIVDFWAPWCEPCKQLTPLIERLVTEQNGAVRLVKINVDENKELAGQLRIQSIPTVYAFADGKPLDGFSGALPESQLRAFIEKAVEAGGGAVPAPGADKIEAAKAALDAGDAETAMQYFAMAMEDDPANTAAMVGLAQCALMLGDTAQAKQILEQLPPELDRDADVVAARAALELAEQSAESGEIAPLEQAVLANPADHQARFDLANALFGGNQPADAVEHLLEIVRRDRTWNEEAAREQLLKIFEALGPTHEVTLSGRRGLSSILFS